MGGKNDKRPKSYGSSYGSVAAEAAVDNMIEWLREFQARSEGATKECADAVWLQQLKTVQAGSDAYGEELTETKEGTRPMAGAMGAIDISPRGKQIAVTLSGHEVAHQIGWAKGYRGGTKMRRPVIPEPRKGIPKRWAEAIKGVLREALGLG